MAATATDHQALEDIGWPEDRVRAELSPPELERLIGTFGPQDETAVQALASVLDSMLAEEAEADA